MIDSLSIQFVTDEDGNKKAVMIPIEEWEQLQDDIREMNAYRSLKTSLSAAFLQVKAIQAGKLPRTSLESFLNEC